MEFSIAQQTLVFFQACALGVGIGLFYDLLRAVRIIFKARFFLTAAADIVFCLGFLSALFVFILNAADGVIRSYIFIGIFIGACLYFCSVSSVIISAVIFIINLFSRLFGYVKSFYVYVLSAVKKLCLKKFSKKLKKFEKDSLSFEKNDLL